MIAVKVKYFMYPIQAVSFYARVTFMTNIVQIELMQIEHKNHIQNSVFSGGEGTDNLIFYSA
jgi:hypothetical protein